MHETLRDLLREASNRLANVSDSPQLDAEVLMAHALQRGRSWLDAWPEHRPDAASAARVAQLVAARAAGRPVAHLVGSREFWSLSLAVSDATLIPRPETELLVQTVLQLALAENARVLDLGTGSGAIAVALASERPGWRITAVDRSPEAVAIARGNAQRHGVSIDFRIGDWFAPLRADNPRFDLVVSNPPYIADDDPHLQHGDVRFEPRSALAAGSDGLDDLRRIVAGTPGFLDAGGWLWLEHGHTQAAAVAELLAAGGFTDLAAYSDLAGLPRLSGARLPPDHDTA